MHTNDPSNISPFQRKMFFSSQIGCTAFLDPLKCNTAEEKNKSNLSSSTSDFSLYESGPLLERN